MIELFSNNKDEMAIVTDSKDEREFIMDMSRLLGDMLSNAHFFSISQDDDVAARAQLAAEEPLSLFENNWELELNWILPEIVDICCKYRGYKNGVKEKRLLIAGAFGFKGAKPIARTPDIEIPKPQTKQSK